MKVKIESSADLRVNQVFKDLHKQKAKEVKRIILRDKRRFYHVKTEKAEAARARGDQRTLYRIVKDLGSAYSG